MSRIGGLITILLGIIAIVGGLYLGIWWCLVLGIVDIIDQIKAVKTDAFTIATAIVRIVFFELPIVIGFWVGIFLIGCGTFLMSPNKVKIQRRIR